MTQLKNSDDNPLTSLIVLSKKTIFVIALYGFILNLIWELAHAGSLYDMWKKVDTSIGIFHIFIASVGDMIMVIAITNFSAKLSQVFSISSISAKFYFYMLFFGMVSGVILEWSAKALNFWTYNELMPTLTILGEDVGLSPFLQMSTLPLLSVILSKKYHLSKN
ncbi:MAG: hypothetical protein ABJR05_00880 [Balneola sp.]